jgi:hypothetical protein
MPGYQRPFFALRAAFLLAAAFLTGAFETFLTTFFEEAAVCWTLKSH